MTEYRVEALGGNFFKFFTPELTLLIGLLMLIIVPNLGKGTFRVPGTQLRLPWFFGGERYEVTGSPKIPGMIGTFFLFCAFFQLVAVFFLSETAQDSVLAHATGDQSVRILAATPFSRMLEMILLGALSLVSLASIDRFAASPVSSRMSVNSLYNNRRQADFYIMLMTSALGMSIVALAENLFVLFMGLELATFSIYVLVAFNKESKTSSEAGMKYFIVGSAASGVGLYGLSLLYLWSGTLQIDLLAEAWAGIGQEKLPFVALGLILVGFGFKISAVPFHFAAPDAYSGASSPIAGLLATASKTMGMIGLFRVLLVITLPQGTDEGIIWLIVLGVLAAVTMTWGNIAALGSKNPKRMLAYSSVAHAGYMLATLTAVGVWNFGQSGLTDEALISAKWALTALLFHLAVLVAFKLGAFLVLAVMEMEGELTDSSALAGLAKRDPFIAVAMFIFMLALAGVPPLAGFLSKFLMIQSIVNVATTSSGATLFGLDLHWVWALALLLVLNSAISVFYYLRIGVVMFFDKAEKGRTGALPNGIALRMAIVFCLIGTIALGIWADNFLTICQDAAAALLS